jgi:D-alanyl-D-alanine carboxypeptidase/Putative Flp pilus-assembly TadE/G-like
VSLIAVCLSTLLTLGCAVFTVDVGRVTWQRARAQTAADAAVLAAAAESGPYGRGDPKLQARRFAAANGARVVECLCDRGATAMQVKVTLGPISAQARAVLDPSLLRPASVAFDGRGLQPRLAAAVRTLMTAAHGSVRVLSGFRSAGEQSVLWERALRRYGGPGAAGHWVARPGTSMHERGLAVDLTGDLALAARLIHQRHLPLWRPLANEPWHFELLGSRG